MLNKEHKKLERLFLFSEVAKCLNFTEAANNLSISKGYLSSQIKQLEADLKTPLLVRTTRTVRLTRAGHQVAQDFKQVHHSMLAIERNLASEQLAIEGPINITAPKQFTESILIDVCLAFTERYPKISIAIDSSYTLYDLTENNFDIALRATNSPPENMIAKKLFDYGYVCCASPDYLSRFGPITTAEQLSEHTCLTNVNEPTWRIDNVDIPVSGSVAINDNVVLRTLAIEGKGVVRLPEYFVKKAIVNKQLVALFRADSAIGQSIYILQPQLLYSSQKVIEFISFLQTTLKN